MKHRSARSNFALQLAASLAALFLSQSARGSLQANGTVVGNNQITTSGPVSTSLLGTTFVNQGLVGVGRISALDKDAWGESLGSVSGMQILPGSWQSTGGGTYAGTFFTLPDRGYNSGAQFSDYAARLQRFDFSFTPYYGTPATGQNQLALTYNGTGSSQFTYNNPLASGFTTTTGLDPAAQTQTLFGTTLPLAVNQAIGNTTFPVNKLPVDAEALVLKANGTGYVGDEYGPNIYYFNSAHEITGLITPPAAILPHSPASMLNFDSVNVPVDGRRNNQGMEGVALSPDGNHLFGLMQSATIQDSNSSADQTRHNTRLLVYDVSSDPTPANAIAEYALTLPIYRSNGNPASAANKTAAQSEIIALDDHRLLVLSRDGNGYGNLPFTNPEVFKSVLLVDLTGATNILGAFDAEGGNISTTSGILNPSITPLAWTEALNMLNTTQLATFGLNANVTSQDMNTLSEKWEAMSLVSALDPLNPNDYFLFIGNDNDFLTTNGTMLQADGSYFTYNATLNNDTMLLAYRVTIAPGAIPEPGTFAVVAGAVALGTMLATRRRC